MVDHDTTTRPGWAMLVVLCVAVLLLAVPADASRDLPITIKRSLDVPVVGPSDLDLKAPVRRSLPFFSIANLGAFSGGLAYRYDDLQILVGTTFCIFDGPGRLSSSTEGDRFSHPHFFQGLWTDPVTGIAYARNRWYDARTASWLSEDPMGAVDSPNLYAFVGWGPHVGRDPMGLAAYAFDGTGNNRHDPSKPETHVANLLGLYEGSRNYYPGVGSGGPADEVVGGLTGFRARARLQDAYWDLVKQYNENDKEIVILGFSRGAAMAREFANMIRTEGIPDLSSARKEKRTYKTREGPITQEVTVYDRYFEEPEIKFVGLFDTVASFGKPGNDINLTYDLGIPRNVKKAAQATALHETRRGFPLSSIVDPANPDDPRIIEQAFCGVHSEIGGGYFDRGTSRISFVWMYRQAEAAGVDLAPLPSEYKPGNAEPSLWHDSREGLYWFTDMLPDLINGRNEREIYYYKNEPVSP